jgi:hypothetical protein
MKKSNQLRSSGSGSQSETVHARIDGLMARALAEAASQERVRVSKVARRALDMYLEEQAGKRAWAERKARLQGGDWKVLELIMTRAVLETIETLPLAKGRDERFYRHYAKQCIRVLRKVRWQVVQRTAPSSKFLAIFPHNDFDGKEVYRKAEQAAVLAIRGN